MSGEESRTTAAPARALRVARRLLRWAVKAFLIVTVLSLTFNTLTRPPSTLPAPTGSDVEVSGTRIHFEKWGSHGTPIVLVHGFVESTLAWESVAQRLARDHVVYALDLPGYGYSEYSGRYTLRDESDAVAGFITALHLDRPAVVGHSLGAAVVGDLALRHPSLVRGMIFADGDAMPFSGDSGSRSDVMRAVFTTPYATSLYRVMTRWTWLDRQIFLDQCGSSCPAGTPALVRAWMRPMRQGDAERALPRIAAAGVLHLDHAAVRRISVPRGIIWGAEDATSGGSLEGARADLRDPHTVVVPGAGHLSMVANPDAFANAVRSILAGWPAA